jgi:hypothetical protein
VKEVKIEGGRYIVCRNEEEARKGAEARATLLAGLQPPGQQLPLDARNDAASRHA